jgi:hypothetical protein
MAESEQADFKQSLLSFDKVLDADAARVAAAHDWLAANKSAYALTNACITCRIMWKNNTNCANDSTPQAR